MEQIITLVVILVSDFLLFIVVVVDMERSVPCILVRGLFFLWAR